jgi:hypothetical protein
MRLDVRVHAGEDIPWLLDPVNVIPNEVEHASHTTTSAHVQHNPNDEMFDVVVSHRTLFHVKASELESPCGHMLDVDSDASVSRNINPLSSCCDDNPMLALPPQDRDGCHETQIVHEDLDSDLEYDPFDFQEHDGQPECYSDDDNQVCSAQESEEYDAWQAQQLLHLDLYCLEHP